MSEAEFDPGRALLRALEAQLERLAATHEIADRLGFKIDRVDEDLAAAVKLVTELRARISGGYLA
jgi:hypothetical protein